MPLLRREGAGGVARRDGGGIAVQSFHPRGRALLRFTHAISYKRLSRLFANLYALTISEGALDAMFRRAKPCFDNQTAAILARLRRSRVVCSDETSVRISGKTCWNWVFENDAVVIHVIRKSRATAVVTEVMDGHRPAIWVSDLYGPQQGHADAWQVCLAHQLRDCQFAIEAGDSVFAPRMKALLLRAVVIARRRHDLAESTRCQYCRRLDNDLDAIMALAPGNRPRKRYGKVRGDLFTFLLHPKSARQQWLRTRTPAHRDLSRGHRRLQIRLGRRSLRRSAIRHRHSQSTKRRCL